MGKVRDGIPDDPTAMAQWVTRKLRNHDPMSVRDEGKNKKRRNGQVAEINANKPTEVRYNMRNGRAFKITVEEVNPDAEDQQDFQPMADESVLFDDNG